MALIGLGMIPFLRPDMHMEFLLLAWLALPITSPVSGPPWPAGSAANYLRSISP